MKTPDQPRARRMSVWWWICLKRSGRERNYDDGERALLGDSAAGSMNTAHAFNGIVKSIFELY